MSSRLVRQSMLTKGEIRRKYDSFASKYDLVEGSVEVLGLRRLRRKLLAQATGRVLEIGVGTGTNLSLYPRSCQITAVDLSPGMMDIARKKAARRGLQVDFHVTDAENLPFEDGSFDVVVDTLSTCTITDPVRALREMARVCRKDGRVLLLEHGRSDGRRLGRFQDWRSESHARSLGCVWNREPLELVREAGLNVISNKRSFFGIFHSIVVAS